MLARLNCIAVSCAAPFVFLLAWFIKLWKFGGKSATRQTVKGIKSLAEHIQADWRTKKITFR